MKALKNCKWEVVITTESSDTNYWKATTKSITGFTDEHDGTPLKEYWGKVFSNRKSAINNWKKFAELNGITNYKIVDV